MQVVWIGIPSSKRCSYFVKAANDYQVNIIILSYLDFIEDKEKFLQAIPHNSVIKFDSPESEKATYRSFIQRGSGKEEKLHLEDHLLNSFSFPTFWWFYGFQSILCDIEKSILEARGNVHFVNSSQELLQMLHKPNTNILLTQNNLPTAAAFHHIHSFRQLLDTMIKRKQRNVFVKLYCGSGAAGIAALQVHPRTKTCIMYSTLQFLDGHFFNTKRTWKTNDQQLIECTIEQLIAHGAHIEEWLPKSSIGEFQYDLRIVMLKQQPIYFIARASKTPITNLHLDNRKFHLNELGLSKIQMEDITSLCQRTMEVFPNSAIAGIDLLLHKHTSKPYIIEVNGFGDLIHDDIYQDNQIYRKQIQYIKSLGD